VDLGGRKLDSEQELHGKKIDQVITRIRADFEETSANRRDFLSPVASIHINNRLGTTVLGGEVEPPSDVENIPVDLQGDGDGFLVADLGSNIVERVGPDGEPERVAGLGIPGDTVGTGQSPGVARLPPVTGLAVDPSGNLCTTHGDFVLVTNRGATPLSFGSTVVPPGTLRKGIEGLSSATSIRRHPSGAFLWLEAPGGAARMMAFNPADPGAPTLDLGGVAVAPGVAVVVAGGGTDGTDGAPALLADLSLATALAVGSDGEVYFAERTIGRVRAVNLGASPVAIGGRLLSPGAVDTVAGGNGRGRTGDGGPARSAQLGLVAAIAVLPGRGLLIADSSSSKIRMADLGPDPLVFAERTVAPANLDWVAGGGVYPAGVAARDLAVDDPRALAVDASGSVLLAFLDTRGATGGAWRVVLINPAATSVDAYGGPLGPGRTWVVYDATLRGGLPLQGPSAAHLLYQRTNDAFFTDRTTIRVLNLFKRSMNYAGLTVGSGGSVVLAGGAVPGFSGDGGPGRSAAFARPSALASPPAEGRSDLVPLLFVADTDNDRVRVLHFGDAATATPLDAIGVIVDAGNVDTVVGGAAGPLAGDGDGLPPRSVVLSRPRGLAMIRQGGSDILLVADTGHHRIRAVNPGPGAVTLAGVVVPPGIVATILGDGIPGFTSDGPGPWRTDTPSALTVGGGLLFFAEEGNARIRVLNLGTTPARIARNDIPPGEVRTLVGTGVRGHEGDGDLGPRVRVDRPSGLFLQTQAHMPRALYFTDAAENLVRVLNLNEDEDLDLVVTTVPPGSVVTQAGGPNRPGFPNSPGFEGDGALPASMRFDTPRGVVWMPIGSLEPAHVLVMDERNDRLRRYGATATRSPFVEP
jgi:hypothetical protein